MNLDPLLIELRDRGGSDLHLKTGRPPLYRIAGDLIPQNNYPEVTSEDLSTTMSQVMGAERYRIFTQEMEADFSYEIKGVGRYRVNAFIQRGQIGAVLRYVPLDVPTLEQLGLPEVLKDFSDHPNGLIIVTGPTGSGKSTTLAAVIQHINMRAQLHIVTIEDPIEFVYTDAMCTINQRELGIDTHELHRALRAALRQDPDVILMGEMRDVDTIRFAITAAETGHLVFSTLHTNDAKQSLDRILDSFEGPEALQVRLQLALVLRGVVSQRLIKRADGQGRVAAVEVLVNTSYVNQLIEQGQTRDLEKAISEGAHYKMQTFNQALYQLWAKGLITQDEALANSGTPDDLQLMMRGIQRGTAADEVLKHQGGAETAGKGSSGKTLAPLPLPKSSHLMPAVTSKDAPANASGRQQAKKTPGRGFEF